MPVSTSVAVAQHSPDPTAWHTFLHDVLPALALTFGLVALIWLACTVVTLCGAYLGTLAFVGARGLIRACARHVRRRRNAEYAQLVTVHPDGVTTKIINLDHYRRHRQRPGRSVSTERPDDTEPGADGPA
ncbi:hypothetical protein [Saccharopolyspora rectivirgula]|uniref:hypothetical protein n=1 Tax=Saccharopolyspora rectivirgula TaxID=28042 RepID=UPI0024097B0D|nr:hypothetical protein [Saccharopolyspora rectivirgula]